MTGNNPDLDFVNINAFLKLGEVLKILSRNEIQTPVKGHNSIINVRKMMCNIQNLDLVNINAYINIQNLVKFY